MLFGGGIMLIIYVNVSHAVVLTNMEPFNCGSVRILLIAIESEGRSRRLDWLVFID